MNLQDEMQKAVDNIRANHNKIIDDWCKAYLAQRYKEGKSIDVGSFTLCQQNLSWAQNEVGFKYWFEDGKPNYNGSDAWIKCSDRLPEDFQEVVCYIPGINGHLPGRDWQDSDFCIGQQFKGYWKRMDNVNIQVSHWMPLPTPPKDEK